VVPLMAGALGSGYHYTVAGDEVLLVSPLNRVVVGVFSERN